MRLVIVLILTCVLAGCDKQAAPVLDPDKQMLADAKDLATKGDLEGAHTKISQIAVDSPTRQANEVLEIETRWGQSRVANADAEADVTKRVALLREVANASAVSPDVRNQASNKLALIETEPKLPELLSHYDPKVASANVEACKQLLLERKMKEPRDLLYPRVTGGIGSPEERDMLVSICILSKDKECLLKMEELGLARKGTADDAMRPQNKVAQPCPSCKLPPMLPIGDH